MAAEQLSGPPWGPGLLTEAPQTNLMAPSLHQDTGIIAMCIPEGNSLQQGIRQQLAGRAGSCTLPGPASCQLQLRSLSGGLTVPCGTQRQTPALLPPGWLPGLASQPPAAATPCPLPLSLPRVGSYADGTGTSCLPAPCALPATTFITAPNLTAAAVRRKQSSGRFDTAAAAGAAAAAAGAESADDSEEPDTPGSSDMSWDSDYVAPPERKKRGRPCASRPSVGIKHIQQQMQALARTRSTLHTRLAELRAINDQLHSQLAVLQSGWSEMKAANDNLRAVIGDLRRLVEHYGPQLELQAQPQPLQ